MKYVYRNIIEKKGLFTLFSISFIITCLSYGLCGANNEWSFVRPETSLYSYKIINVYPHDPKAFTQGLIYERGFLYESTGLHGRSSLRKVELTTGRVLKTRRLPKKYFGEGITSWGKRIVQVTWRSGKAFIYDMETFHVVGEYEYKREGWGITFNGEHFIMSDGTARLQFLDPRTFKVVRHLSVTDGQRPVPLLNELEYIKGEIYANIWNTGYIVRISPQTGTVVGWIDLHGLYGEIGDRRDEDVLNGIAYDPEKDLLFVTGKFWPKLFEIRIIRKE